MALPADRSGLPLGLPESWVRDGVFKLCFPPRGRSGPRSEVGVQRAILESNAAREARPRRRYRPRARLNAETPAACGRLVTEKRR